MPEGDNLRSLKQPWNVIASFLAASVICNCACSKLDSAMVRSFSIFFRVLKLMPSLLEMIFKNFLSGFFFLFKVTVYVLLVLFVFKTSLERKSIAWVKIGLKTKQRSKA